MNINILPHFRGETSERSARLASELRIALGQVPKKEFAKCILLTPVHAVAGLKRRCSRAFNLTKRLVVQADDFVVEGYQCIRKGEAQRFTSRSWQSGKEATTSAITKSNEVAQKVKQWLRDVRTDPASVLPEVIGSTLGFLIGSGGIQADGGLPDLDLITGIGNHRSFISHSIVMGAAAEAVLIALDEVVLLTHKHLPYDHDPLWDSLYSQFQRATGAATVGVGFGIAYHLGVDGSIQFASYKDLPFSMPMEAHQAVFEANAGVEALYAATPRTKTQSGDNRQ